MCPSGRKKGHYAPFSPDSILKHIISNLLFLAIIVTLLCSCTGGDAEYTSFTNGGNRIFIRNTLSRYTKQDFIANYAKDVNDFYDEILNIDITKKCIDIFVFPDKFTDFINSAFFHKFLKQKQTNASEIIDKFLYSIEISNGNLWGVFIPGIDTILIKMESIYSPYEEAMELLIAEYNHYLLKQKANQLEYNDLHYWNFFIDEGITNFYVDYYMLYNSKLDRTKMIDYVNDHEYFIDEGIITIDKNKIYGCPVEKLITLAGDDFELAIDFHVWLIQDFGADKYLNFLRYLYTSNYDSLDNCFVETFGLSFQDAFSSWYED